MHATISLHSVFRITDLHSVRKQAGITQVEDLSTADNELLSALRDPSSMAADIVKYLEDLRGNGFNPCSPKNKLKIPVEIPVSIVSIMRHCYHTDSIRHIVWRN